MTAPAPRSTAGRFGRAPRPTGTELGGIPNPATNLGASLGTAISGSILIAVVTASFVANIQASPSIPENVKSQTEVELPGGASFISDADSQAALDEANVEEGAGQAALHAYSDARLDGLKTALAILALFTLTAIFVAPRIPTSQPQAPAGVT